MTGHDRMRDDEWLSRLLRSSGRGPTASPEARERIYGTVRDRWQAAIAEDGDAPSARTGWVDPHGPRRRRRPVLMRFALAAAVAAAAVVVYRLQSPPTDSDALFATVASTAGEAEVRRGDLVRPVGDRGIRQLRVGDEVVTRADGRLALSLAAGQSLRVDVQSELGVIAPDLVELRAGRVYFDSVGPALPSSPDAADALASSDPMRIDTPFGQVQHAGTQFEAGLVDSALRVRVREGLIVVRDDSREISARAGEELRIAASGRPERTAIAADDAAWQWVEGLAILAPAAEYRLDDVLRWAARETGHALEFAPESAESRAASVLLYDLQGLTPRETLEVVRSTTAFEYLDAGSTLRVTETAP